MKRENRCSPRRQRSGGSSAYRSTRFGDRELLFVAGYETSGTLAAAKLLSKPNPVVTRFNQVFQRDGYAEMVLQIKHGSDEAVLYQFDGIENPRGKDAN